MLVLLLTDTVRVARVSGHIRELPLVAIRVNVSILAPYNAVGTSDFLLEAAISCFITERKGPIIIILTVIANSLYRRLF
jgi:hypothetical protein